MKRILAKIHYTIDTADTFIIMKTYSREKLIWSLNNYKEQTSYFKGAALESFEVEWSITLFMLLVFMWNDNNDWLHLKQLRTTLDQSMFLM